MENFLKEFNRVSKNPIYFIEKYYNIVNNEPLQLTDEQKQNLYNKYKGIPLFENWGSISKHEETIKRLKKEGYKDWEM